MDASSIVSNTIPFGGWSNCLRIANDEVELITTLDVGPRILSFRRHDAPNVLKNYDGQLGGSLESEWMIRGGHRLWVAPEDEHLSYHRDNDPVFWKRDGDGPAVISSRMTAPHALRKDLSIRLANKGSRVDLLHTITNEGTAPITLATWAMTVMEPGGTEIIPQTPLGNHVSPPFHGNTQDLLPNRNVVLWPYTDLTDPRWKIGASYFLLRQQAGAPPTKLGLAHSEGWIGYLVSGELFLKAFPLVPEATYPDGGCNFETFTNGEMLEIESLGPLVTLQPGEGTSHPETWHLVAAPKGLDPSSEASLDRELQPLLVSLS